MPNANYAPRSLGRRSFCAWGAAAMAPGAASVAYPAEALPYAADAFVDSVGINVHLASPPYRDAFGTIAQAVAALGVRHLRDELRPSNDLAAWRSLYDKARVRCHLLVSPVTNTVPEMLAYLKALGAEAVSAIEGQNEGDSPWFKAQPAGRPDWASAVVSYQRSVYQAIRKVYPVSALPVVSPTVLDYLPADMQTLRPAAAHCDVVALHPYPQGLQEPETPDRYAGWDWYRRSFATPFKPRAPVMATEAGYVTGGAGVSRQAQAKYTPRLLLHAFATGFGRTFLYELMDEGSNADDPEQNFGLIAADGTPKPAFDALGMLLHALADPGPPFIPGKAPIALVRGPPSLRMVPFIQRHGVAVIALWQAVRAWDPVARRDIKTDAEPVTLRLASPSRRAEVLLLRTGQAWQPRAAASAMVEIPVGDTVTLLRLQP